MAYDKPFLTYEKQIEKLEKEYNLNCSERKEDWWCTGKLRLSCWSVWS